MNYLEISTVLPCGHTLKQRCSQDTTLTPEDFALRSEILDFWLKTYTAAHDCALVAKGNPFGRRAPLTAQMKA